MTKTEDIRSVGKRKKDAKYSPRRKGIYLLNFRLPQLARISIPLPNKRNDPKSRAGLGFPLSVGIAEEWSRVTERFASAPICAELFDGKKNISENTFPNRGVTAPAVNVMATRMMAIFCQLRFTLSPSLDAQLEQARNLFRSFTIILSNDHASLGERNGNITT